MAQMTVTTTPPATTVNVQDANNLTVQVVKGSELNVSVQPAPTQTIQISRGVPGPAGPNAIGGYPIQIATPQNYDALMFVSNQWVNVPQTQITDGGNF